MTLRTALPLTLAAAFITGCALEVQNRQPAQELAQADVVLDCSDNLPTRLALNAACVAAAKPLVSGSAIRWQGQGFVYLPGQAAPCYQCLYPQSGADAVDIAAEPCATMGVFAPLVLQVGSWQASEALKDRKSTRLNSSH